MFFSLRQWWKKENFFKRGTVVWFCEGEGFHTEVILSKPNGFSGMMTELEFELHRMGGGVEKKWGVKNLSFEKPFVIYSTQFQPTFQNPKTYHLSLPWYGYLLITPKRRNLFEAPFDLAVRHYKDG